MSYNTFTRIYEVVKQIPRGCVATYGQIAEIAGNKMWARTVGNALHVNPDPDTIPCHRIVNAKGKVAKSYAFGGEEAQALRLQQEGVRVINGKVDLEEYQWECQQRIKS